jgi:integrase
MTKHKKPAPSTLWDAYLLTASLHWRGTRNEEHSVGHVAGILLTLGKDYPVDKIDSAVVSSLVAGWKLKGLAGATVNRKLAALGKVLTTAFRAGMRTAPAPTGLRLRESPGRTRVVSPEELSTLASRMDKNHADLATFLYHTGLRVSEALNLRKVDVTVSRLAWPTAVRVLQNKADLPRTVPVPNGPGRDALRDRMESVQHQNPLVFRSLTESAAQAQARFNRSWNAVKVYMGLESDAEFVPHALRHTCATNLVLQGVPLPVVQKWLGHRSITVTQKYAHVNDAQLVEAARLMDADRNRAVPTDREGSER